MNTNVNLSSIVNLSSMDASHPSLNLSNLPLATTPNPLPEAIVFTVNGESVRIPIYEPENAPSPRKLPKDTIIDLLKHQAPYVVSLNRDSDGYLYVPQHGNHFHRYGNVVYVFYTTDEELNVTGVYYGQTTEPFKRMSKYNTLFHDTQDRINEEQGGRPAIKKTRKGIKIRKGASNPETDRKVFQTIVGSKRAFWGIITLPSDLDSMNRHEKRQITLAKQAEKVMQSGFIVLNVQSGRTCLGPIEIPSPTKPILTPRILDIPVCSPAKRKFNFDSIEDDVELKKKKVESKGEENARESQVKEEKLEPKVGKFTFGRKSEVKNVPVVKKSVPKAKGFVFHDYVPNA